MKYNAIQLAFLYFYIFLICGGFLFFYPLFTHQVEDKPLNHCEHCLSNLTANKDQELCCPVCGLCYGQIGASQTVIEAKLRISETK